jgi:hypothetical protein
MTTTFGLQITQGIGYTGKMSNRAWVAEITGTDSTRVFARTFLDATRVERDHFGRARYTRTYTYELGPGLYEVSEHGERRYLLVWAKTDGAGRYNPDEGRVREMARLMDAGHGFEAARKATKPAPVATA